MLSPQGMWKAELVAIEGTDRSQQWHHLRFNEPELLPKQTSLQDGNAPEKITGSYQGKMKVSTGNYNGNVWLFTI